MLCCEEKRATTGTENTDKSRIVKLGNVQTTNITRTTIGAFLLESAQTHHVEITGNRTDKIFCSRNGTHSLKVTYTYSRFITI